MRSLRQRVDLPAQGDDDLIENFRICEERRLQGRNGMGERSETGSALAGVQAVLEGIAVEGLAAVTERENRRRKGI